MLTIADTVNRDAAVALTLEVRNSSLTICQTHGKTNRLPTDKERGGLTRWASSAGLKIASHV